MSEQKSFDFKTYIYDTLTSIYRDVETMTTGNLAHRKACLLHDIYAVTNNCRYVETHIEEIAKDIKEKAK